MFLFPNLFWSAVDHFMTPQGTCDELGPQLALQISKFPDKTPRQWEIYVECPDRLDTEWEGSLMGIRAQRAHDRSIRQESPNWHRFQCATTIFQYEIFSVYLMTYQDIWSYGVRYCSTSERMASWIAGQVDTMKILALALLNIIREKHWRFGAIRRCIYTYIIT